MIWQDLLCDILFVGLDVNTIEETHFVYDIDARA